MAFHFYILHSASIDRYYIGHTGNSIEERLCKHNSNHKGFTGGKSDWILVYSEEYKTRSEAYARELEVKGWKDRSRMERLFKTDRHPG